MNRLTAAAQKTTRQQMLRAQGGKCKLCGEPCSEKEAVLDHDHKTGRIRAVLHRGCNAMLGHIENNRPRHKLTSYARLARFLNAVPEYIARDYSNMPLHSTYRTEDEKRERRNKKARERRAARKS